MNLTIKRLIFSLLSMIWLLTYGKPIIWTTFYKIYVKTDFSLYIIDFNPLSASLLANIFSHPVSCLFVLLLFSFAVQKFDVVSLFCLFYFPCFWGLVHQYPSETKVLKFSICFSRVFCFRFYILNTLWVNCCVRCQRAIYFHSFACGFPVFPTLFIEDAVLSILYVLGFFVKI